MIAAVAGLPGEFNVDPRTNCNELPYVVVVVVVVQYATKDDDLKLDADQLLVSCAVIVCHIFLTACLN